MDRVFCHFRPFFALWPSYQHEKSNFWKRDMIILNLCTTNDDHMMYASWDKERDSQNFSSQWTIFCPFTSLTTWKIIFFKKMKKMPRDIIILHMCTINDNHMMYGSWDIVRNRQNFCPFTPLTTQKIAWICHHFTPVYQKW